MGPTVVGEWTTIYFVTIRLCTVEVENVLIIEGPKEVHEKITKHEESFRRVVESYV